MRLIPFNPELARLIVPYYCEPEYSHWCRGAGRYLTLEECQHLPEIYRSEFLHIWHDNHPIGLIRIKEETKEVFNLAIVIDKEFQGQKLAHTAVDISLNYLRDIKGARLALSDTVDDWIPESWLKTGWVEIGSIPNYVLVDGEYLTTRFFYKKLR